MQTFPLIMFPYQQMTHSRFFVLLWIVNLLLRNTYVLCLLWLHRKLVFLENLSRFLMNSPSWGIIFNSFILPAFECCSPLRCFAAVSHLKLLDRNLNAIKFLIPELAVDLWHRRAVSSLCMLYKIFHNVDHPVHTT